MLLKLCNIYIIFISVGSLISTPAIPVSSFIRFDAIVSADAFENLKPSPDIFLAASKILDVIPSEVHEKNFIFCLNKRFLNNEVDGICKCYYSVQLHIHRRNRR